MNLILSTINRSCRLFPALLAVPVLALAAACSADPTPTPTQPPATATPTPAPTATPTPTPDPVNVVATTNIVADWVEQIAGDNADTFSLLPVGADPHGYQPGAQDVARVADADLVLSIGLGLEEAWLIELVSNAARDPSTIVELAELIDPIEFAESHIEDVELLEDIAHAAHEAEEGEITIEAAIEEIKELLAAFEEAEEGHEGEEEGAEEDEEEEHHEDEAMEEEEGHGEEPAEEAGEIIERYESGELSAEEALEEFEALAEEGEEEHEGHGHGLEDPHFWFDPLRVKIAVDHIAARLSTLDPDRAGDYVANADAYKAQLDELDAWTIAQVAAVPEDRRLLVTSHDSLGYFADRYGFEVIGVVLGVGTDVEPSAEHLVELVEDVRGYGVPAVFGETTVSERLAATVAEESGVKLVRLYSGSLGGQDSGANTYVSMVRANVESIVEALR